MNISNILGMIPVYIRFMQPLYVSYVWNVYEIVVSINDSSSSFLRTKWNRRMTFFWELAIYITSFRKYSSRWKPTGTSGWQYVKTPSGQISEVCTGVWMSKARKQTDVWRSSTKETRLLI